MLHLPLSMKKNIWKNIELVWTEHAAKSDGLEQNYRKQQN